MAVKQGPTGSRLMEDVRRANEGRPLTTDAEWEAMTGQLIAAKAGLQLQVKKKVNEIGELVEQNVLNFMPAVISKNYAAVPKLPELPNLGPQIIEMQLVGPVAETSSLIGQLGLLDDVADLLYELTARLFGGLVGAFLDGDEKYAIFIGSRYYGVMEGEAFHEWMTSMGPNARRNVRAKSDRMAQNRWSRTPEHTYDDPAHAEDTGEWWDFFNFPDWDLSPWEGWLPGV
jgi:hypothetical protein